MAHLLKYDHYKVLGVSRDADPITIRDRYRHLVKQVHPDKNRSPKATEVFRAVHEAYRVLSDPQRRAAFDRRSCFYTPASSKPEQRRVKPTRPLVDMPPTSWDRFAFQGLHLTGLLFGSVLIAGLLIGTTFMDWPWGTLVFCVPGMAVIPDSLEGLRMK